MGSNFVCLTVHKLRICKGWMKSLLDQRWNYICIWKSSYSLVKLLQTCKTPMTVIFLLKVPNDILTLKYTIWSMTYLFKALFLNALFLIVHIMPFNADMFWVWCITAGLWNNLSVPPTDNNIFVHLLRELSPFFALLLISLNITSNGWTGKYNMTLDHLFTFFWGNVFSR